MTLSTCFLERFETVRNSEMVVKIQMELGLMWEDGVMRVYLL